MKDKIYNEIFVNISGEVIEWQFFISLYEKLSVANDILLNKTYAETIMHILHDINYDENKYIPLYSFAFQLYPTENDLIKFIELVIKDSRLTWDNIFFISTRLSKITFFNKNCNTEKVNIYLWNLLRESLKRFKEETGIVLERIPEEELIGDTQLVFTTQFLAEEHGPTKTTMDRAKALKKRYSNVFIINTAEAMTRSGSRGINYFDTVAGSYNDNFSNIECVEWKGQKYPYFQCDNDMPNVDEIMLLINTVKQLKPKVCVLVGGFSLFGGIVNELIPTLMVGCTQSNICQTLCDYSVADKYQIELNKNVIKTVNYKDCIIEGKFTFSIKNQEEFPTKKELGIRENVFTISVVGGRLNEEISDEWWEQIAKVNQDIEVLLIGGYSNDDEVIRKFPTLKGKINNLGYCNDVLSRICLSDLYVNPIRKGGATSAVEALSVGVPVLTTNYGDVAGTVGEDFYCDKIEEFPDLIAKYCNDAEFYNLQREKAFKLAGQLLDNDAEFLRVVDTYLQKRKESYSKR